MDVAQKNEYFRATNGPWRPPRLPLCNRFNTKTLPFWCSVMKVTKKLDDITKKWIWGRKTAFLAPKRIILGNLCQKTGRRTGTYRKTKKWVIWAQNPFFGNAIQIFCHHHDGTPKRQGFCVEPVARGATVKQQQQSNNNKTTTKEKQNENNENKNTSVGQVVAKKD